MFTLLLSPQPQLGLPHSALRTPMPTPQAMPVATAVENQKPGGGGMKNGGYAGYGHAPKTMVGLYCGTKITSGCAGWITMTCVGAPWRTIVTSGGGGASTVTFICSLDL